MPRIVDLGVTQYLWIPGENGIANELMPDLSELTATGVKNISSQVVTTTTLDVEASDTVNERSVTDVANVVTPTVGNYAGSLVLFRDYENGEPTANDPLAVIGSSVGVIGWIAKRVGKPAAQAAAEGDEYDVYLVMIDNPQTTGGQGEGFLKATFPLLQQGRFKKGAKVTAAAGGAGS
ncbi:hypothetical protein DNL40_02310 [Xylanimonas oleitrophica]|uniref:Phage tail protein n=1 Tax=Xylanimonas oleitrophica TaxID=2607479 RepID=A0A2W5WX41_9MICO|nr:hypothetical protein [Xylanimonas oleitrophica]PZR55223.1 hypothetical protein DNL40_02310 [Xylanimonas oleitrophica]